MWDGNFRLTVNELPWQMTALATTMAPKTGRKAKENETQMVGGTDRKMSFGFSGLATSWSSNAVGVFKSQDSSFGIGGLGTVGGLGGNFTKNGATADFAVGSGFGAVGGFGSLLGFGHVADSGGVVDAVQDVVRFAVAGSVSKTQTVPWFSSSVAGMRDTVNRLRDDGDDSD
jgi:hypothetical protein